MQIGEVIRKYRKNKNLTQEEMARRLGVTTPAVNKWEHGNSMPDIMLLAPIARLLEISLDELLSFHESLTVEEIRNLTEEMSKKLQRESYAEVFQWARKVMEQYPNCSLLILRMTQLLDSWRILKGIPDAEQYDSFFCDCYIRILNCGDEDIRSAAADCLFSFYLRKEQYEQAEEYLAYFSKENPERKRKQAVIFAKTDRIEQARRLYEELLFSGCQMACIVLNSLYQLAVEYSDMEMARLYAKKQEGLERLLDMGEYRAAITALDLAMKEKDTEQTLQLAETALKNVETICDFCDSPLYAHMALKKLSKDFIDKTRQALQKAFRDEETYGYMKDDDRWKALLGSIENQ